MKCSVFTAGSATGYFLAAPSSFGDDALRGQHDCGSNALGATNVSNNGGGVGANARWTFMDKHNGFRSAWVDGGGIGRYGSGGLPDAAVYANGGLDLIRSYQGLATSGMARQKLDVYLDAGGNMRGDGRLRSD